MDVVPGNTLLPGDPRLIDHIVCELKSQGIFDQFRKECIADVDTKPAYQNLRQRVEGSVTGFLKLQQWKPDMNKNHLREMLRKNIYESGFLETGVERIVDQVVNPKINTVFLPQVEDVVYKFLGLEKPNRNNTPKTSNGPLTINTVDLLPTDLDPISPDSEVLDKALNKSANLDDSKGDDYESPPFEPITEQSVYMQIDENSNESRISGISGLTSHDSNISDSAAPEVNNQDSQLSKVSSNSRLSIITTDSKHTPEKMDISEDTDTSKSSNNNPFKIEEGFKELSSFNDFSKIRQEIKDELEAIKYEINGSRDGNATQDKIKDILEVLSEKKNILKEEKVEENKIKEEKVEENKIKEEKVEENKIKEEKVEEHKIKEVKVEEQKIKEEQVEEQKIKEEKVEEKPKEMKVVVKDEIPTEMTVKAEKIEKVEDVKKSEKSEKRRDKDKDKKLDKDKERKHSSSSSRDKDRHRDNKSRDKSKDSKSRSHSSSKRSSSSKSDSKSSKDSKKSDESRSKSRKSDSKSSRDRSRSESTKNSSKDHTSSNKDKKDVKKPVKKEKDDHHSSRDKKSANRRSADRDSNDGSSGTGNQSSASAKDKENCTSSSSKSKNSASNSDSSQGSNESGQSDSQTSQATLESQILQKTPVKVQNVESETEVVVNPQNLSDLSITQQLKLKKPKFASNIFEARKLMKIRKKLEKLEKKRQKQLVNKENSNLESVEDTDSMDSGQLLISGPETEEEGKEHAEILLNQPKVVLNRSLRDTDKKCDVTNNSVVSKESWDAIEAKLSQSAYKNVDFDSYVDDNCDSSCSSKPGKRFSEDEDCLYFNNQISPTTERFLKSVETYQKNSELEAEEKMAPPNVEEPAKNARKVRSKKSSKGKKRKLVEEIYVENNNKKINNSYNIVDAAEEFDEVMEPSPSASNTSNGSLEATNTRKASTNRKRTKKNSVNSSELFSLPLSPESDKSGITPEKESTPQTKSSRISFLKSQRYSSDDLYKPRPFVSGSSRRQRRLLNSTDEK